MTPEPIEPKQSDVTTHLPVLLIGLRWLFDTEQPAGAVQCPAGDSLHSTAGRAFRFIPAGRDARAAIGIAVTTGRADDAIDGHEIAGFIDLLEDMGEEVVSIDTRVAPSFCTLTLARSAHPTLRRAVARYRAEHIMRANASPFGPASPTEITTAVSATDLCRQLMEDRTRYGDHGPSKPELYWVDLDDSPAARTSAATDRESRFAAP